MAHSDVSLTDMDMSVCMLDRDRVILGHYYVKQDIYPPFPHAGVSCRDVIKLVHPPSPTLFWYCLLLLSFTIIVGSRNSVSTNFNPPTQLFGFIKFDSKLAKSRRNNQ